MFFSWQSHRLSYYSWNIHIIFQFWNQHLCWLWLSLCLEVYVTAKRKWGVCCTNNTLYTKYTTKYPHIRSWSHRFDLEMQFSQDLAFSVASCVNYQIYEITLLLFFKSGNILTSTSESIFRFSWFYFGK